MLNHEGGALSGVLIVGGFEGRCGSRPADGFGPMAFTAFVLESLMDGAKYFRNAAERYRRLAFKATEEPVKAQHLRLSIAMDNLAADIETACVAAGAAQAAALQGNRPTLVSSRLH